MVFISKYIPIYGARRFSLIGGVVMLVAWLTAWWGGDSYAGIIIAILLIDAGMQSIHLANQTSVFLWTGTAIAGLTFIALSLLVSFTFKRNKI